MNSSYDQEVDAYYFDNGSGAKSVRTVSLGMREVNADIDVYGNIVGIELL